MLEQRRYRRRDLDKNGTISFHGSKGRITLDCVVKDISATGALLLAFTAIDIPEELKLTVEGIFDQDCLVKWREWVSAELAVEFV
jgi:hypothetical protein